jgi:hypothetical protein
MFEYITFGLLLLKIVFDFVAPRTKTLIDDKIKAGVDKANELAPLTKPLFPAAPTAAPTASPREVSGFKADGGVRDHR